VHGVRDRLRRSVFEQMQALLARIQVTPPRPVMLVETMDEMLERRRAPAGDPRDALRNDRPMS
jgi:hypothetical protein